MGQIAKEGLLNLQGVSGIYNVGEKNYQAAGFWVRLVADFLDFMIVLVPISLIYYFIVYGGISVDYSGNIISNIIYIIYLIITPIIWRGYAVGKRICKINIQRVDGQKLNIRTMVLRELIGKVLLTSITFGISIIVSIFMISLRKDKRAIHDLIAGTFVNR